MPALDPMRIVVIGLGHVGIVTTACLLHHGHVVLGIDIEEKIISRVSAGLSPIRESYGGEISRSWLRRSPFIRVKALDTEFNADLILVCVGTPAAQYHLDLSHVSQAARDIGEEIRKRAIRYRPF